MNRFVLAVFLCAIAGPAFACPSPLTGRDAAGTSQNFGVTLDGSSNCYGNIAIVDGSNAANKATVTAGNALKVDGSAVTQPVSGTVTANQGGAPWTVNPGTPANWGIGATGSAVPANGVLSSMSQGGNTTALTGTGGNLNVNIAGNSFGTLTVSGTVTANQGTSPWVDNVSQFGGNNVVTGTGASGLGIPRVTISNDSNILATQSGTWTVQQGGAPWSVSQATAANLNATVVGTGTFSVQCTSGCTGGASTGTINNSAGQILGGNIAGQNNIAFQTNQAFQLPASAGLPAATQLWDGQHYLSMVLPNGVAQQAQTAAVVRNPDTGSIADTAFAGSGNATQIAIEKGLYAAVTSSIPAGTNSIGGVTQSGAWSFVCTSGCTGSGGTNLANTAGQAIGQVLPGLNNIPLSTNQSFTLPAATAFPAPAQQLWDGQHYVSVAPPNTAPTAAQSALVVTLSPNSPSSGTGANVNVSQFGGTNVVTGTGASGLGIPRFTVSNDSNILATQSGTWTVQQGGAPWTVNPGTAANWGIGATGSAVPANAVLEGMSQGGNTTALTGTSGNLNVNLAASAATVTVSGTVTSNQGGAPWSQNVTQWNSVALGSPSNYGTSPGAVSVPGVNAFVTNTVTVSGTVTANQGTANATPWNENVAQFGGTNVVTGTGASGSGIPRVTVSNDSNILATQSGTWTVQQGTPPWTVNPGTAANWAIGATGSAVPANAVLEGMSQGGNTTALTGTAGNLNVNLAASAATVTVAGTVTANEGGAPWTVERVNSAGQQLGANLPGANNIAAQVNQAFTLPLVAPFPPTANQIWDGQHYASIAPSNIAATAQQTAIVTAISPNSNAVTAAQSGTWTVQPGNTANTTPWLTTINQGGNSATVNASGQLTVNCAAGCTATSFADASAFTLGTTSFNPIGGFYSSAPAQLTTGQAGIALLTQGRILQDNPRNSAGQEIGARLPSANSIPIQVNQAQNLTQYNGQLFGTPTDASGSLRTASVIYDGQHYADVVSAANPGAGPQNGALVVVPSPKLSLQCPFTVGINQTAATQIVTNPGTKSLHICGFGFVSASAQNVSLVEGTGSTCGTGTAGLVGGTAASIAAAANGGLWNMTDRITIPMQKPGDNLCVLQSAAGNVSGTLTYGIF